MHGGKMAIADSALPRFEIGRVIRRTVSVIASNIVTLAVLSLIPGLSLAAIGDPFDDGSGGLTLPSFNTLLITAVLGLFYLASGVVLQGAVVHAAFTTLNGRRVSIGDCLATGLRYVVPLFLIGILATLGVVAGLLLLVIPGIMLAVMWIVVTPACVVEHTGVPGAFRRSRELTRGYRWSIFGLLVVLVILVFIATLVLGVLTVIVIGFSQGGIAEIANFPAVEMLNSAMSTMLTSVLTSTLAASIYYELRQIKEGVGPEALAAVFD
jgi:hypothetical protein